MAKFTKKLRQEIVDDFLSRHDGTFCRKAFLEEVRAAGPDHPAYKWFEWDDDRAADLYRLDQVSDFVRGLRITFRIEEIRHGSIRLVAREAPSLVSPPDNRSNGGGYRPYDPNDPAAVAALAKEGASTLRSWIRRYGSLLDEVEADSLSAVAARLEAEAGITPKPAEEKKPARRRAKGNEEVRAQA